MAQEGNTYDDAAQEAVELGNRLADADQQADVWDVADGLLAGAVHYWLYSRQPCADPRCEDCAPIRFAEQRLAELLRFTEELAKDSEYFHSPHDMNVGRA
jgi:hypothetical protein